MTYSGDPALKIFAWYKFSRIFSTVKYAKISTYTVLSPKVLKHRFFKKYISEFMCMGKAFLTPLKVKIRSSSENIQTYFFSSYATRKYSKHHGRSNKNKATVAKVNK